MAKRQTRRAAVARCRVCHRELTNPAHAAVGVGPICAQRAARQAAVTQARADGYSTERAARIQRNVARLAAMVAQGETGWTPEAYDLICHWLRRWRNIQARTMVAAR